MIFYGLSIFAFFWALSTGVMAWYISNIKDVGSWTRGYEKELALGAYMIMVLPHLLFTFFLFLQKYWAGILFLGIHLFFGVPNLIAGEFLGSLPFLLSALIIGTSLFFLQKQKKPSSPHQQ